MKEALPNLKNQDDNEIIEKQQSKLELFNLKIN